MNSRIKTSAPETICHTADAYIFIYADGLCDELSNDESEKVWQRFQGIPWDGKICWLTVLCFHMSTERRTSSVNTGGSVNTDMPFRALTILTQD